MKPRNRGPREIGFYFLVMIILISAVYLFAIPSEQPAPVIEYSELRRLFIDQEVLSFSYNDANNRITVNIRPRYPETEPSTVTHDLYNFMIFYMDVGDYIRDMMADEEFNYNLIPSARTPWWVALLPYVILIALFFFIWTTVINRAGGVGGDKGAMRFGKARTRVATEEAKKVTFADVQGADEEKEELREIVDFLKGP